jgi:hypothetical protein
VTVLTVCAVAIVIFLLRYDSDHMRPGGSYPLGWYNSWYDQGQYYDMVLHIPQGTLGAFSYPPLYPFLGFLGKFAGRVLHTYHRDPFFFVDLLFFITYVFFAHRTFERFLNPALSLAASVVLIQASVDQFVTPWTTTVSAACLMILVDIFTSGRYTVRSGLLAGMAGGFMFGARIADALPAAAVGLYLFFDGRTSWQIRRRFFVSGILSASLIAAVVIAVDLKFTGNILGNYFTNIMSQGRTLLGIPVKMYGYLFDPFTFHRETNPLAIPIVGQTLFLLLAPLGIFLLLRAPYRKLAVGPVFILALVGWAVIYTPFVAVTGLTLKYLSQHYFKAILPTVIGAGFFVIAEIAELGTREEHQSRSVRRLLLIYLGVITCILGGFRFFAPRKLELTTAMLSSSSNPSQLSKMIDGDLHTRWDSAQPQQPGLEFDIDFGKTRVVQRVVLDTADSPNDYARQLSISYSLDGKSWAPWTATNQSETATVSDLVSEARSVRWLKFKDEGTDPVFWWSVHEISIYGR